MTAEARRGASGKSRATSDAADRPARHREARRSRRIPSTSTSDGLAPRPPLLVSLPRRLAGEPGRPHAHRPAAGVDGRSLQLGVRLVSALGTRLFHRVSTPRREDLDLIVHLGDYIYEYSPQPNDVRESTGAEIATLDDYRTRYALYRSDPIPPRRARNVPVRRHVGRP